MARAKSYGDGAKVPPGAGRLIPASEIQPGDVIGLSATAPKTTVYGVTDHETIIEIDLGQRAPRRDPGESVILYMRDGLPVFPST